MVQEHLPRTREEAIRFMHFVLPERMRPWLAQGSGAAPQDDRQLVQWVVRHLHLADNKELLTDLGCNSAPLAAEMLIKAFRSAAGQ